MQAFTPSICDITSVKSFCVGLGMNYYILFKFFILISENLIEKEEIIEPKILEDSIGNQEIQNEVETVEETVEPEIQKEEIKIPKIKLVSDKIYPKIQLNLNDRIAFIAQLFGGTEKCNAAIEALNQLDNKEDAMKLFSEMSLLFNWATKMEYAERLKDLIENRFR